MLLQLLRTQLRPYKPLLGGVVVLQFVGTMAALYPEGGYILRDPSPHHKKKMRVKFLTTQFLL